MRQAENLATGQDMQGQPVNIQDGIQDGTGWNGTGRILTGSSLETEEKKRKKSTRTQFILPVILTV